jgi:hypothetical protein
MHELKFVEGWKGPSHRKPPALQSEELISASIADKAELDCGVFMHGKTIAGFEDARSC